MRGEANCGGQDEGSADLCLMLSAATSWLTSRSRF